MSYQESLCCYLFYKKYTLSCGSKIVATFHWNWMSQEPSGSPVAPRFWQNILYPTADATHMPISPQPALFVLPPAPNLPLNAPTGRRVAHQNSVSKLLLQLLWLFLSLSDASLDWKSKPRWFLKLPSQDATKPNRLQTWAFHGTLVPKVSSTPSIIVPPLCLYQFGVEAYFENKQRF